MKQCVNTINEQKGVINDSDNWLISILLHYHIGHKKYDISLILSYYFFAHMALLISR
jgi:hypothetical protein